MIEILTLLFLTLMARDAPIYLDPTLTTIAEHRGVSICALNDTLSHARVEEEVWDLIPWGGHLGENLGTYSTAGAVQEAFMNSQGHKNTLQNPVYNRIGIARVDCDVGRPLRVVWVVIFSS